MPDIIIHGATSFLGKHFSQKLIGEGISFNIVARTSSELSFIESTRGVNIVRYQKTPDEIKPEDISVHAPVFFEFSWHGVFGAERNIPDQFTVNIPLLISSINLARRIKARHWIGFGSQAEYGNLNKLITENDSCHPVSIYGKSKYFCSQISSELCNAYGINHSWLRLFSVYGPDDNHEWLIQYLIKKMLANEEIEVTLGEQIWDYLYVDDISDMLLRLMYSKGCGIANLGSGTGFKVKSIIELIKELTNSHSVIHYGAIPYRNDQVMNMVADITKLQSLIEWSPNTSLRSGLNKTIEYFRHRAKL